LKPFSQIKTALYRAGTVAIRRYEDDRLDLQAMSLTYTTLLSLVPFLAVMFSVLKHSGYKILWNLCWDNCSDRWGRSQLRSLDG